jgi:hypothetical protein
MNAPINIDSAVESAAMEAVLRAASASQIAIMSVKLAADIPSLLHGEMDANPKPDPSATSSSEAAEATAAPAQIAGHATAEVDASAVVCDRVVITSSGRVLMVFTLLLVCGSMPDQSQNEDHGNGDTQQPK